MRSTVRIYKSNTSIEAQVVDGQKTLLGKKYKFTGKKKPLEEAVDFGSEFGAKVLEKKITQISFDRNGSRYHGRVKSFAEGLRKAGLDF